MTKDEYFELLEEQHNHDVILSPSRVDTNVNTKCNNDYCEIGGH